MIAISGLVFYMIEKLKIKIKFVRKLLKNL